MKKTYKAGDILVIESNGTEGLDDVEVHGPFKTPEAAVASVKRCDIGQGDLSEMYLGPNTEWGSDHVLVRVVGTVKPVPVLTVRMTLEKTEHPQKGGVD